MKVATWQHITIKNKVSLIAAIGKKAALTTKIYGSSEQIMVLLRAKQKERRLGYY